MQQMHDPPPPPSMFANIPDGLESVVLRCLNKDRAQRFQTMAEVATALKDYLGSGALEDLARLVKVTQQEVLRKEQILNSATAVFAGKSTLVMAPSAMSSKTVIHFVPPASAAPPPPFPTAAAGSGPRLDLLLADGDLRIYPLTESQTSIGRTPDSGVVLNDQIGVSRYHATIRRTPDGFVLVDMNTKNGSYVNGTRVLEPTTLADLDEVQIGGARLRFHEQ